MDGSIAEPCIRMLAEINLTCETEPGSCVNALQRSLLSNCIRDLECLVQPFSLRVSCVIYSVKGLKEIYGDYKGVWVRCKKMSYCMEDYMMTAVVEPVGLYAEAPEAI